MGEKKLEGTCFDAKKRRAEEGLNKVIEKSLWNTFLKFERI